MCFCRGIHTKISIGRQHNPNSFSFGNFKVKFLLCVTAQICSTTKMLSIITLAAVLSCVCAQINPNSLNLGAVPGLNFNAPIPGLTNYNNQIPGLNYNALNAGVPGINYNAPIPPVNYNAAVPPVNYNAQLPTINNYNPPIPGVNYNAALPGVNYNAGLQGVNYNAPVPTVNYNTPIPGINYNGAIPPVNYNVPAPPVNYNVPVPPVPAVNYNPQIPLDYNFNLNRGNPQYDQTPFTAGEVDYTYTDPKTGKKHNRIEKTEDGVTRGSYTVDGRTVTYTADAINGFRATVNRGSGHGLPQAPRANNPNAIQTENDPDKAKALAERSQALAKHARQLAKHAQRVAEQQGGTQLNAA